MAEGTVGINSDGGRKKKKRLRCGPGTKRALSTGPKTAQRYFILMAQVSKSKLYQLPVPL